MNQSEIDKLKEKAVANAAAFGIGAAIGAHTKHAIKHSTWIRFGGVEKFGSQVGAAIANGTLGSSVAAGTALVTAKVAAVAAVGVAAVPYVAAAGIGYGLYRLGKKLFS
jgi:hypothetical protein